MMKKCCLCGKLLRNDELFRAETYQRDGVCCWSCYTECVLPAREIISGMGVASGTPLNLKIKNWNKYQSEERS